MKFKVMGHEIMKITFHGNFMPHEIPFKVFQIFHGHENIFIGHE